jgi:hypothetical protein
MGDLKRFAFISDAVNSMNAGSYLRHCGHLSTSCL